jgi:hypothetical protein
MKYKTPIRMIDVIEMMECDHPPENPQTFLAETRIRLDEAIGKGLRIYYSTPRREPSIIIQAWEQAQVKHKQSLQGDRK